MYSYKNKSFTLIEMLIVIVIIGILAAALVPRLQSVQARARDTKRKTDLKQIYSANEIHMLDYGAYAKPRNANITTGDYDMIAWPNSENSQPWISGLAAYMTSLPVDPINDGVVALNGWHYGGIAHPPFHTGNFNYSYGYVVNAGKTYDLTTRLENPQDPDRCAIKQYRFNASSTGFGSLRCPGGYNAMIYEYSPDSNSF